MNHIWIISILYRFYKVEAYILFWNVLELIKSIYRDDFMDYYHVDEKYCSKDDGGDEYWRGMDNNVTFNFFFSPLNRNNYFYYYSEYEDWLQTAEIEVHLKCSDGSKLRGIESDQPATTPATTTLATTTINSHYVNGLDQEYLIDFFNKFQMRKYTV